MRAIAQILVFMVYWETLGVNAFCMIRGRMLKDTSLIADAQKSIPLIGIVLTFACNYQDVMSKIVELAHCR